MRRSPLKRKTPLRKRGESKEGAIWRDARDAALDRDNHECRPHVLLLIDGDCDGWPLEVHHIQRRSQGGDNHPDNLISCCRSAHRWIHANPADAYQLGLLKRSAA